MPSNFLSLLTGSFAIPAAEKPDRRDDGGGAVTCVARREGRLVGENSDGRGHALAGLIAARTPAAAADTAVMRKTLEEVLVP
jgi:shikimate 5-dehydrogenase